MLYRSTDRLCRSGAPMENLCHSASFESDEKNAPSKSGTKHLVPLKVYWWRDTLPAGRMTIIAAKWCVGGEAMYRIEECGLYEGTPQGSPARFARSGANRCWGGGDEFCDAAAGGR